MREKCKINQGRHSLKRLEKCIMRFLALQCTKNSLISCLEVFSRYFLPRRKEIVLFVKNPTTRLQHSLSIVSDDHPFSLIRKKPLKIEKGTFFMTLFPCSKVKVRNSPRFFSALTNRTWQAPLPTEEPFTARPGPVHGRV